MIRSVLLILCLLVSFPAFCQDPDNSAPDSLIVVENNRDTILIESYARRYNPRKALLYAAVLPGLGQIYNKKYWKLPIVYGGMFATGYAIQQYASQYAEYRSVVFRAVEAGLGDTEDPNQKFPELQMRNTLRVYRNATEKARRERDFYIIIMGLVYVLQMVDAHVDAHLKEFDLNPRLQVSIEPMIEQNPLMGRQTGASIVIRF